MTNTATNEPVFFAGLNLSRLDSRQCTALKVASEAGLLTYVESIAATMRSQVAAGRRLGHPDAEIRKRLLAFTHDYCAERTRPDPDLPMSPRDMIMSIVTAAVDQATDEPPAGAGGTETPTTPTTPIND